MPPGRRRLGLAISLGGLAQISCETGDLDRAKMVLSEMLALCARIDFQPGLLYALVGFARVAALSGYLRRSARLLGAIAAMCDRLGGITPPHDEFHRRAMNAARANLDEPCFATAWVAGQALSLEQAIDEATANDDVTVPPVLALPTLTPRERDVLRLLVAGQSDRASGAALSISPRTVERHITNILNKLGLPSRTALVAYAVRHSLG